MNTANLQLEGLCTAVGALMGALRDKGMLSADEIEQALARAEAEIGSDPKRPTELSAAHAHAIRFPLRYLRLANRTAAEGRHLSFAELTALVGQSKPDR